MYANITDVTREKSYFGSQREGREFEAKFGFQMFQGNRAEQCLATVRSKCLQHKTVNPQSWTDAVLISVGTEIHIRKAPGHNPSSNFRSASQSLGISADPFNGIQEMLRAGTCTGQGNPSSPHLSLVAILQGWI